MTEPLRVGAAGPGAIDCRGGRVIATGAGWAWIEAGGGPVHVTGRDGPMLPVTARVPRVPLLRPGEIIELDPARALPWRTPELPTLAPRDILEDACRSVEAHRWNDPRALTLGSRPFEAAVGDLVGRGPGLTPAGDDVLLGWLTARRDAAEAAAVASAAKGSTTGPSLALLEWAGRGEFPEVAVQMHRALAQGAGAEIPAALRRLTALGRTTGRAILTGLLAGLRSSI